MSLLSAIARSIRIPNKALARAAYLVVALGAAGLSSCGPVLYPLDSAALQARGLNPGEGYIVATFQSSQLTSSGKQANRGANTTIAARGKGSAKGTVAALCPQVMPLNRNPYLMGGGKPGEVIAIPVPAGDYEITNWSMTGTGSSGPVTVMNRLPMKVPFQVRAGEATYVGHFHDIALIGRNLLGFPVFSRGMILASDEFNSDEAKISKAYPTIKRSTIRRSNVPGAFMEDMKRIADEPWWKTF